MYTHRIGLGGVSFHFIDEFLIFFFLNEDCSNIAELQMICILGVFLPEIHPKPAPITGMTKSRGLQASTGILDGCRDCTGADCTAWMFSG